jgi:hypothetical protein
MRHYCRDNEIIFTIAQYIHTAFPATTKLVIALTGLSGPSGLSCFGEIIFIRTLTILGAALWLGVTQTITTENIGLVNGLLFVLR